MAERRRRRSRFRVVSAGAILAALAIGVSVVLAGCGGGTSSGGASASDPRAVAIQKALDTKSPTESIESGTICDVDSGYYYYRLKKFASIPGVTISPEFVGHQTYNSGGYPAKPPYLKEKCRRVTWSASSGAQIKPDSIFGTVPLGRYVVDKVGDDSQQMGTTVAAFRAYFEPTATGRPLWRATNTTLSRKSTPMGRRSCTKMRTETGSPNSEAP